MTSKRFTTVLVSVLALFAALAAGCSPKAKLERHIASAQRYMAEGRYDAAEIEFLNAQRIDPRNGAAMAGLGALYFDQGSLTKAAPRLLAGRELAPDDLDARVRLARAFATLGRTEDARTEALFILGRRASDPEALQLLAETSATPEQIAEARARTTADDAASHVALAMLALRENQVPDAVTHADRALELDPKFAPAHALKAGIHLLRNELDPAEASLKTAADLSPARSPRRLSLARFQLARGETAAGRQTLEDAVKDAPDFLPASIMLAELALSSGAHDEAQKLLTSVLTRDPDHPEAAFLRARVHLARGENTTAIELLEKLVAKYPDAAPMHQALASAYLAANDTNRASASLARAVQLAPDNTDAIIMRSALQMRSGDPASAIPALRDVVKKHPENSRARILLADALRARGQPDEALQIYREAIEASPDDPQLRYFAGGLHTQLGQTDEARRAFEQGLALKPDFTACVEQLVALDLAAKDLPAAARRAEAHAAAFPTSAEAQVLVAKVAVAEDDTTRAEAALRRAIENAPDSAAPYMLLAQLYLRGSRQDEALANLQTAVAKNPRDISALMLIGILQQEKGELQAAREAYERLLQANPRFVPALNNLAYLCSESFGELDRAYELANLAREIRPNDPIALDTFGWILFQRRDYTWALSVLSESASKLSENPEVNYHLGMTRYMLGDEAGARAALAFAAGASTDFPGKDKAAAHLAILEIAPDSASEATIATLRARIASVPDDPVALSRLGAILAQRGQHEEALATFESVLKAHPASANARIHLAAYLLTRPGGLARAFELAKEAYKAAPEDPLVLHTLGRAAFASGDHAWAASLLREAVRRSPGSPVVQADLADAIYAVGSVDDAATAMRAALAGDLPPARATKARAFLDLIETASAGSIPSNAQDAAAAALAQDPDNVPALMVAAAVSEQRGDISGALAAYDKALGSYPRFTPALKRRAILLARENPPTPRAFEAASKAREALPGDPEVAGALGTIHFRRGEFPRAATLLGEAARSPQASPETHYILGLAQGQVGDKERSRASLQRALDLGLSGEAAAEARTALAAP